MNTQDYRLAPSGEGPHAAEWADKPHRLIYDLCREVERLQDRNKDLEVTSKRYQVLLRFAGATRTEAFNLLDWQQRAVVGQLEAQARVLGFEFDKDDPRSRTDIIQHQVAVGFSQRIMLELVAQLAAIDKEREELFDALQM